MASFIFDTCCGCIELRTGCLIIGYLNLIFGIVGIAMGALIATAVGVAVNQESFKFDNKEIHLNTEMKEVGNGLVIALGVILIIIFLLYFTFTIVLLVGVHQNKRGHVKAYLVYAVIFLVLYIIQFFASFAQSPISASNIASQLVSILLSLYFIMVIRSFYHKMNDSNRQPAIYNTA